VTTLRPATVADARAIAEVHVDGWRWGYRGLLPDEVIDGLDVDAREAQWVSGFTDRWQAGDACFLAEDDAGRIVGFVACGPAADEFAPPPAGAGEIYAIYVREDVRGTGVGRDLLGAAHRALAANGFTHAVLWVFEANGGARRFYETAGWRADGVVGVHRFEGGERPVLRYVREG